MKKVFKQRGVSYIFTTFGETAEITLYILTHCYGKCEHVDTEITECESNKPCHVLRSESDLKCTSKICNSVPIKRGPKLPILSEWFSTT